MLLQYVSKMADMCMLPYLKHIKNDFAHPNHSKNEEQHRYQQTPFIHFTCPCYSQVIVRKSTLSVCQSVVLVFYPIIVCFVTDCRPGVKAWSMYFPLVYDEYSLSSLPPLVLLRVHFFTKIRSQIKKIRIIIRIFRRGRK